MNEKKKKILSELIEDSEREVKESKSKLLPLGIFFTLGGIISIITFFIEASYSDFDEDFIAILLYYGLVGIIGGPSIIIYYFKLKHDIKKLNNTDE
jgi:drug/metabolite transporter (DMT)-like permease